MKQYMENLVESMPTACVKAVVLHAKGGYTQYERSLEDVELIYQSNTCNKNGFGASIRIANVKI